MKKYSAFLYCSPSNRCAWRYSYFHIRFIYPLISLLFWKNLIMLVRSFCKQIPKFRENVAGFGVAI